MCGFFVDTGSGVEKGILETVSNTINYRGPDASMNWTHGDRHLFFHRLAIMDASASGMQPFVLPGKLALVCNGEIYNEPQLKAEFPNYSFQSSSDCEVLIPMLLRYGIEKMVVKLDAEFAFAIYDMERDCFFAGRDPLGIRPLFYGAAKTNGKMMFASEAKALQRLCEGIKPFPPGHYFDGETGHFHMFKDLTDVKSHHGEHISTAECQIRELLVNAVEKRLRSDVPVGFLLSGGLDSSLVCSIASRILDKPLTTFSVGITKDPIDTSYARDVAKFLGTKHHEVLFTREEVFEALPTVIYHLETWDITTIRASIGMYLLCKYIRESTDIRVVLTGEVSDEIFGYKYTDYAPSAEAFQKEAEKRVQELHVYDVLRADRCISAHGLEARVPFGDTEFVDYVIGIAPGMKMNTTGIGKYLLRKAFDGGDFLPEHILYREKAAFSDAVGHSMVDELKAMSERTISDQELLEAKNIYPENTPFSKEALMYRKIFDDHFPELGHLTPSYWMPNREWENCDVMDPSARVLPNYGASGGTHSICKENKRVAV